MPTPHHQTTEDRADRKRRRRSSHVATPVVLSGKLASAVQWLAAHTLLVCVVLILILAFLAEIPWLTRPQRTLALQIAVVLLYTFLAVAGPDEGRFTTLLRRGLNPWALALLAWSAFSACLAPYHAFAIAELLRLALGAGVYFAVAYVLRPHETSLLPSVLLGIGCVVGFYGLIQFGVEKNLGNDVDNSIFGNHEQFGSFLALLFPPALALALERREQTKQRQTKQRRMGPLLFAQGAALILGATLLLARTRSAWTGAAVGLLALSLLALRYTSLRLNRSNKYLVIGPAFIVALAFIGLLTFSQLTPLVSQRAASLSHVLDDTSFSDRLHRWRSACRMASERPLTGWGLGAFSVVQGRWTHQGDDVSEVLGSGTGHSNLAHNFWVQWAAETGGVGLTLHIALLAAFFILGLRALPRLPRERRTLLIACLAGVASGTVDMIGAPSYTFPGVSSLFWLWIGLGMSQVRADQGQGGEKPRLTDGLLSIGIGLAVTLAVLGIGGELRAAGLRVPRGTLTVIAEPSGPVTPGTRVLWMASYRDPSGKLRPTAPGVVWTATEGRLEKTSPTFISINDDPHRSGWQGNVPAGTSHVTMTAHYWDNFSREYSASQAITVPMAKRP